MATEDRMQSTIRTRGAPTTADDPRPAPPAFERGFLVVANAAAGSADEHAIGVAVERLAASAPVELCRTSSPEEIDSAARQLDGRALVVAGGDGSLHTVIGRLDALGCLTTTPVGLVPLGTGNDFARCLGISLDPAEAADQIVRASLRAFDLIRASDGGIVVNAVHAGVGAEAADTAARWKPRFGKAAYPLGALVAGVRSPGWALNVVVDGRPLDDDPRGDAPVLTVAVGNGDSIGGGTSLIPDAKPDDGLLDVVVARTAGPLRRISFAASLARGRHVEREDVRRATGLSVTISGEAVRHNIDGEISDPVLEASYRIEPSAWWLLAPERSAA